MALVKVTYINHIHNLATQATRTIDAPITDVDPKLGDPDIALEALAPAQPEEQTFAVLVRQLPSELQELLRILVNDAKSIPMLGLPNGTRETTNEYLCRLIGADPKNLNVEGVLRAHFSQ